VWVPRLALVALLFARAKGIWRFTLCARFSLGTVLPCASANQSIFIGLAWILNFLAGLFL
jgi:hypothetical protein